MAVRSGNDVIVLKACPNERGKPGNTPLEVIIYKHGELTPGTKIMSFNGGKKYEVSWPAQQVMLIICCTSKVSPWLHSTVGTICFRGTLTQSPGISEYWDYKIELEINLELGMFGTFNLEFGPYITFM